MGIFRQRNEQSQPVPEVAKNFSPEVLRHFDRVVDKGPEQERLRTVTCVKDLTLVAARVTLNVTFRPVVGDKYHKPRPLSSDVLTKISSRLPAGRAEISFTRRGSGRAFDKDDPHDQETRKKLQSAYDAVVPERVKREHERVLGLPPGESLYFVGKELHCPSLGDGYGKSMQTRASQTLHDLLDCLGG